MRLLTRSLVGVLLACAAACTPDDTLTEDGAERCYGGYGVAVHLAVQACPMAADLDRTQIKLLAGGAEHNYDYIWLVDRVAFPWPADFFQGDPARAEVTLYSEEGACRIVGSADFVIDPETCTSVEIPVPCTCASP